MYTFRVEQTRSFGVLGVDYIVTNPKGEHIATYMNRDVARYICDMLNRFHRFGNF